MLVLSLKFFVLYMVFSHYLFLSSPLGFGCGRFLLFPSTIRFLSFFAWRKRSPTLQPLPGGVSRIIPPRFDAPGLYQTLRLCFPLLFLFCSPPSLSNSPPRTSPQRALSSDSISPQSCIGQNTRCARRPGIECLCWALTLTPCYPTIQEGVDPLWQVRRPGNHI